VSAAASAAALWLALSVVSTPAWGQDPGRPPYAAFRVSWQPQTEGIVRRIEGRVQNPSRFRVTNVRLRVEGLDADSAPVAQRFTWTFGDIVPGGEASFVVDGIPGAVSYRIAVYSFDVVSVAQSP